MPVDEDLLKDSDQASAYPAHGPEPWKPEIVEALYGLLYRDSPGVDRLVLDLQKMERREGPAVYVELLYLLCHIRFEPGEAREHWEEVVRHREQLESTLGYPVELSVALVSYFVHVSGKLRNPKVIELKLFEETRASAYKDELTGLHNFRFFQEFLGWEVKRCERSGGEFAIALGDLDNFKDYNDRFGHEVGNEALEAVGRALKSAGRDQDVAVRYGGEEFVLLMPETSKEDAGRVADRVCHAIAELDVSAVHPQRGVTMSLGVASYPGDALEPEALIRCADRAMYTAKAKGKNQVQIYGANRRALRRVRVEVEGEIRILEAEGIPFSTLDICERGLRFKAKQALDTNSMVEFVLRLPGHRRGIKAYGRVVRCAESDDGLHEIALEIMDIETREFMALTRYLSKQASVSSGEPVSD